MRYQSSAALRRALEDRLGASSRETHVALGRLRRRVVFERLVARLEWTEPGKWVVKGGDADGFLFTAAEPEQLATDSGGTPTWRIKIGVQLAGKLFDAVQLDVSPRQHELEIADRIELPNLLAFAGVPAPVVEVVDVHRHAAEKFHAMLRDYGDRENTRVRDLVDLVDRTRAPGSCDVGVSRGRRFRRARCGLAACRIAVSAGGVGRSL
jgi:hypothetical protein